MDRRTRIFVLLGALLAAVGGLVYALTFDVLCACEAFECRCSSLAFPIWAAIGAASGGILGFAAARLTRRS